MFQAVDNMGSHSQRSRPQCARQPATHPAHFGVVGRASRCSEAAVKLPAGCREAAAGPWLRLESGSSG
ncbi:hypothetical protein HaLaN_02003, partial [Haematococcus lacustris]